MSYNADKRLEHEDVFITYRCLYIYIHIYGHIAITIYSLYVCMHGHTHRYIYIYVYIHIHMYNDSLGSVLQLSYNVPQAPVRIIDCGPRITAIALTGVVLSWFCTAVFTSWPLR